MVKQSNPVLDFIKATRGKEGMSLDDSRLYSQLIDTGVYILNGFLSGDMFGGLETGRTTELIGESASGKSALAIYLMVKFLQKFDNGVVYLYESEGRVSESLVTMIPKELYSRLIVVPVSTLDQFAQELTGVLKPQLEEFKDKKHDIRVMIVVDSIGNLGTDKEAEDASKGKNSTTEMKKAQQLKKMFRVISIPLLSKFQIPFVAINHVYDVIGAYVPTKKASGGKGLEYLSNNIIEVARINDEESKATKKTTAFKMKIVKSMCLVGKTNAIIHLNNGKFNKYSSILTIAKEYKIVTDRNAGSKGKVYIFEGKEYTKTDLAKDTETMEKIVKLTNDAWKKDNSFLVDTSSVTNMEPEEDVEENEEEQDEKDIEDEE